MTRYLDALAQEQDRFENCLDVHDLPPIFHYWSETHLRPKVRAFGFDSADGMFAGHLDEQCRRNSEQVKQFVSLGAGNCQLEIELALELRRRGHAAFEIECLELSAAMLERGRLAAQAAGVAQHLIFTQSDLNSWLPGQDFDAVIANHSLHHVVNLEGLFEQVRKSLKTGGSFIISDMIGRNGHLRWPEALVRVQEFWHTLPPSYRINLTTGHYEEEFEDWDCSVQGFEGIRSQDILPLLLREFHFRLFVPFGNIVDPFIDRSFGHHFDIGRAWDLAFIDKVHQADDAAISTGLLTPTHMLAVVGNDRSMPRAFPANLPPEFCVREHKMPVRGNGISVPQPQPSWPHKPEEELEIVCRHLSKTELELKDRTIWVLQLKEELAERTAWALQLRDDLAERTAALGHFHAESEQLKKQWEERTAWARDLEKELADRTNLARELQSVVAERSAWALALESRLEERTTWALALATEVEAKNAWALRLEGELERKIQDVSSLERELHRCLHNPFRYVARLVRAGFKRILLFGRRQ